MLAMCVCSNTFTFGQTSSKRKRGDNNYKYEQQTLNQATNIIENEENNKECIFYFFLFRHWIILQSVLVGVKMINVCAFFGLRFYSRLFILEFFSTLALSFLAFFSAKLQTCVCFFRSSALTLYGVTSLSVLILRANYNKIQRQQQKQWQKQSKSNRTKAQLKCMKRKMFTKNDPANNPNAVERDENKNERAKEKASE